MTVVRRKIIKIDEELCDGCGNCVPACAEGAIEIRDGKARLVSEKYCDGLGACLGECPTGALQIIEREADEFDEEAVEAYLQEKEEQGGATEAPAALSGCPSQQPVTLAPADSCARANEPTVQAGSGSALSHWPVQIRLVPPTAPFLKGAELLVAADCVPFAYGRFHEDFIRGRVVLVGCPKFDDAEEYVRRFGELFEQADIRKVTIVVMEVPCCSALPGIVRKGMRIAGKQIPMEEVVIARNGDIVRKEEHAA